MFRARIHQFHSCWNTRLSIEGPNSGLSIRMPLFMWPVGAGLTLARKR